MTRRDPRRRWRVSGGLTWAVHQGFLLVTERRNAAAFWTALLCQLPKGFNEFAVDPMKGHELKVLQQRKDCPSFKIAQATAVLFADEAATTDPAKGPALEGSTRDSASYTPTFDRILYAPVETPEMIGSLYVPEAYRVKLNEGIVLATGPGRLYGSRGKWWRADVPVKEGQKIMVPRGAGVEVRLVDVNHKTGERRQFNLQSCRLDQVLATIDFAHDARGKTIGMSVQPLNDLVLIKRHGEVERSSGGLIIPTETTAPMLEGTVVRAGPGHRDTWGTLIPTDLDEGQRVLFNGHGGMDLDIGEDAHVILREAEVIGVLQRGWKGHAESRSKPRK